MLLTFTYAHLYPPFILQKGTFQALSDLLAGEDGYSRNGTLIPAY